MFGLTFEKLLIIGIVAVFLLGPDRLPYYASQLAKGVRKLRSFTDSAKDRMREELGPEFDDVDWKKLDPRQYDPRRIIRDALIDDDEPPARPSVRPALGAAAAGAAGATGLIESSSETAPDSAPRAAGSAAPFDTEAT